MTQSAIGIQLNPLDTLFFRDGRPFDAASRGEGGLPTPQPLAGALRTALLARHGFSFQQFAVDCPRDPQTDMRAFLLTYRQIIDHDLQWVVNSHFRGPWLALQNENGLEPLVPTPLTLSRYAPHVGEKGSWFRCTPMGKSVPEWLNSPQQDQSGLTPLWPRLSPQQTFEQYEKSSYPQGFLTLGGVDKFLHGDCPTDEDWFLESELYGFDTRTGIGIDPTALTTIDGEIYGIRLLTLQSEIRRPGEWSGAKISLYGEVIPGKTDVDLQPLLDEPIPFGGESRYASVAVCAGEPVKWPKVDITAARSMWLLVAPGIFTAADQTNTWQPDAIRGAARLVAAATGSPHAVSGWDIARKGPKPARFAVPAGSVFYVEGKIEPKDGSLCENDEDVAQGWGYALEGVD